MFPYVAPSVIPEPVAVFFEQEVVNGSEGNVAVVCVTALIPKSIEGLQQLTVDVSVADQGSAGKRLLHHHACGLDTLLLVNFYIVTEKNDYGPLPSNLTFTPTDLRRCFRILLINDSIAEGTESFTLELSPSQNNNVNNVVYNDTIFIPMNTTVVQILETCFDGEIRLRDGFDKNQGRVEICYNGVWGTVCDDGGWVERRRSNAQVVCQQLGLESQSKQTRNIVICSACKAIISVSGAVSFTQATFGRGSLLAPIHLDEVFCNGSESNLLSCRHNPIGVHDCIHSQDVSVDCLGRMHGK